MMRERLVPLAVTTSALLAVAACSGGDATSTGGSGTSDPVTPRDTTAVPSTSPGRTGDGPTTTGPDNRNRPQGFGARLEFFGDCPALLDHMQTEATERVTPWGLGGGPVMYADDAAVAVDAVEEAVPDAAGAPAPTGGAEGPVYSGTNNQEVGVDEGDIVETDGRFVYVAGQDGVRIVSVADATVVAEPELPQGSHQMLLENGRLLVVTSSWSGSADTIVSLYDVSDPTMPSLLRRSHFEGFVVATRSIDGVARLVISTSFDQRLPFVQPSQFGYDEESALERNREIIAESTVEDWLPRWFEESDDGSFGPLRQILPCEAVATPPDFSGLGLTWIASLELFAEAAPVGSAGIVSTGDIVYASADHLYIATRAWDRSGPEPLGDTSTTGSDNSPTGPPPTLIHQFSLDGGTGAGHVASGEVEGRLLNQFAMSEHDGDLRVATTTDGTGGFGEQSESTVFVLRPTGDILQQIGSIGDLGPAEQIYAVRFIGDLAYVVTFRQIDPLYVIDLADPTDPVAAGELKIPGYSAYLHPVGDGLLLGVGQDATETGRTTGTQLSLFDVSDATDPRRIDTLEVGGSSEVEWDHRAFLFWASDGTIVLPVSPGWNDCGDDADCLSKGIGDDGGAVVAELDGRQLVGRGIIEHPTVPTECWNPLQRSMVVDDELVTIGLDDVVFSDRQSLEPRARVTWADRNDMYCSW